MESFDSCDVPPLELGRNVFNSRYTAWSASVFSSWHNQMMTQCAEGKLFKKTLEKGDMSPELANKSQVVQSF